MALVGPYDSDETLGDGAQRERGRPGITEHGLIITIGTTPEMKHNYNGAALNLANSSRTITFEQGIIML